MSEFNWNYMEKLARDLGVETAALMAVAQVESNQGGFLSPTAKAPRRVTPRGLDVTGRPKILFEPHVFWRELVVRFYNPAKLLVRQDVFDNHGDISDILYQTWGERKYGSETAQWDRLLRAREINQDAANCAASWGFGQVLCGGVVPSKPQIRPNWEALNYESPSEFVNQQFTLDGQAEAFSRFIGVNNLARHLRDHNWAAFAHAYNGAGYKKNQYDVKMAEAYKQLAKR